MKQTKNSIILNKTDVINVENRLDAISQSIINARYNLAWHGSHSKEFREPFFFAVNEANRILNIRRTAMAKAGDKK